MEYPSTKALKKVYRTLCGYEVQASCLGCRDVYYHTVEFEWDIHYSRSVCVAALAGRFADAGAAAVNKAVEDVLRADHSRS